MAFFLCRLNGPRPSFPLDITDEEKALMARHAAYLRDLGEKAIVFGPVLDPKGPWGLGVYEVADEAEMQRILKEDPVLTEGRGFTYDILPMPTAGRGKTTAA